MRRRIITVVIVLACFLLQSTVFSRVLTFASIGPNLMLIVTASFGFMRGSKTGMAVGFLSGALIDLLWGQYLGFGIFLYSLIGYLNGLFQRMFYYDDIKLPIGLIAASEGLYGLVMFVAYHALSGDFMFGTYLVQVILPELTYTILVTLVLYQVIALINRKLETQEQHNASRFV